MNDLQKTDWSLRFESLLDGRAFITDKTIFLDEAYFSVGELTGHTCNRDLHNGLFSS